MLHERHKTMTVIKTIGASGQIALGKQHAGRNVPVEEIEPGVWVVKLGEFVPDSERWLHEPEVRAKLDEATAWAETHPPSESGWRRLRARLEE